MTGITAVKRRLDEISKEVIIGNQYDVRTVSLGYINEVMWLENIQRGSTVTVIPPSQGGPFYFLFVAKPTIEGDGQNA